MHFPNMPLWLLSVVVAFLQALHNPWILGLMAVGLVDIATTIYVFLRFPGSIAERFVVTRWLIDHLGVIGGCVLVRVIMFAILCAFPLGGLFGLTVYMGLCAFYAFWVGNNIWVAERALAAQLLK